MSAGTTTQDIQNLVYTRGGLRPERIEMFDYRGNGTAAVVYATSDEVSAAIERVNGAYLCGSWIVADFWKRTL